MQGSTTSKIIVQAPQSRVDDRLLKTYSVSALACVSIIFAFCCVQIAGWMLAIDWVKHPFPNEPAMPSGAAILFLIACVSAWLMWADQVKLWQRVTAQVLAVLISITGSATFLEHILERDWSLIHPLFEPEGATPLTFPGPMVPDVSFYFMLLGVSLFLFGMRKRLGPKPFQIPALIIGFPNLLICLCDFNGMGHLCAAFGCLKFSPVTSSAFVAFSFALLCSKPEAGLSNIFVRATTGGKLVRRICAGSLLLCTLIPFVRYLAQCGADMKLYDAAQAINIAGIFTGIVVLLVVGGFVVWSVSKVDKVETERTQAEVEKEQAVEALDSVINQETTRRYKHVCLVCTNEFDESHSVCPNDGELLLKIPDTLRAGSIFAERYEVIKVLGAGGMSTVYLTKHLLMNKLMAMKLLHDHLSSDVKAVQRFQREAQSVTLLSHPNLLAVHDFGVSQDGLAYLVMDYLDGSSLQERIESEGPMKWAKAADLFMQLCAGINHAHIKGIVHRDLKPGNVMIMRDDDNRDMAKIVDFGLAKIVNSDTLQNLTRTGEIFGSPLYMAPEQCEGGAMDHRTDIYALGCIMYETLSGKPPFRGASLLETFKQQLSDPPPPFAQALNIPNSITAIVVKALEKAPANRYQTAAELSEAIAAEKAALSQQFPA